MIPAGGAFNKVYAISASNGDDMESQLPYVVRVVSCEAATLSPIQGCTMSLRTPITISPTTGDGSKPE